MLNVRDEESFACIHNSNEIVETKIMISKRAGHKVHVLVNDTTTSILESAWVASSFKRNQENAVDGNIDVHSTYSYIALGVVIP